MIKLDGVAVCKDYESGMSSLEIGKKYDVSKEAILYHLKKMGVVMRKPQVISDKEEIVSLYIGGKSTIEIGKMFGSSHRRISDILKSLGVVMRTRVEALEKYSRKNKCVICGEVFRVKAVSYTHLTLPTN